MTQAADDSSSIDPKVQVRASYNRIAEVYLSSRRRDSPDVALLEDLVSRLTPRSRVLDAGCGAGVPLAQQLATHATVVGVDFADMQLGLAKRHVPTGLWVCADLVALPFADASFDAVCSYYAIIHIPREQHASVLDGVARVLRPRGLALLCLGAVDLPAWTEQYYDAPMYWSHYVARGRDDCGADHRRRRSSRPRGAGRGRPLSPGAYQMMSLRRQ